jgi:hypothetical protein
VWNIIVATSVLPNVLGGLVGAGALVVGVVLTARYTKNLEASKRREELASQAFSDFWRAMAKSAFARDDNERAIALSTATEAKARIVTYGDASLVENLLRFEANGSNGADPACQAAIVAMAQGLRSTADARGILADEDVRRTLFGT